MPLLSRAAANAGETILRVRLGLALSREAAREEGRVHARIGAPGSSSANPEPPPEGTEWLINVPGYRIGVLRSGKALVIEVIEFHPGYLVIEKREIHGAVGWAKSVKAPDEGSRAGFQNVVHSIPDTFERLSRTARRCPTLHPEPAQRREAPIDLIQVERLGVERALSADSILRWSCALPVRADGVEESAHSPGEP